MLRPRVEGNVPVNHHYETSMMNKDQVKGHVEEAKGKVKEATGKAVGNKELEQKGKIEKLGGKVRAGYGDLKEEIKDSTWQSIGPGGSRASAITPGRQPPETSISEVKSPLRTGMNGIETNCGPTG